MIFFVLELVLDVFVSNSILFSAPNSVFRFRRSLLNLVCL